MQFSLATMAGLMAFLTTAKAVTVCNAINSNGGCAGVCTEFDIALNEIIETPSTNCIFNVDTDTDFDLQICAGPNLSGGCSTLSAQPRVTITGSWNWNTPGTGSIKRTGN